MANLCVKVNFFVSIDEYDYGKPLEGQEKVPYDQHWRKHSMVYTDDAGKTDLVYR